MVTLFYVTDMYSSFQSHISYIILSKNLQIKVFRTVI
jgi:hypothetical protein